MIGSQQCPTANQKGLRDFKTLIKTLPDNLLQITNIIWPICQIDVSPRRMPIVTLKLITFQLCKEVKIEKVKKIENYEENLAKLIGKIAFHLV